jgi:uncharacterized RDD family membrane protein YckC
MSDTSQGPGWWQASDGKWYPPEQAPTGTPAAGAPAVAGTSPFGDLADWGTRAIAYLIDGLILFAVFVIGAIIAVVLGAISSTLGGLFFLLVYIAVFLGWLYWAYLVGVKGQSPGMALMGLRCIGMETGQNIGGGMGIVRHFAHIIDSLICYIGWLFPLWDAQRQTIADKLVKTYVLSNQPKKSFALDIFTT